MAFAFSAASAHTASFGVLSRFSAFDWLLLAILVWSTTLALVRGLLREICSLVGLVAGVLLASWYYPRVAVWLERWLPSPAAANLCAFLLIALGAGMACGLLGRLFRRTASTVGLGLLDRAAGGLFGICRGFLLGTALLMGLAAFFPTFSPVRASRLAPYFLDAAHGISFFVPSDLQAQISGGVDTLKHMPTHWIKPRR